MGNAKPFGFCIDPMTIIIQEVHSMETIIVQGDVFEVVDVYPLGYEIWNIGSNMLPGYVPFCRLAGKQPCEGARQIEEESLRAMKSDGAAYILKAARSGCTTLAKMETYLKKHAGSPEHSYERLQRRRIEKALPYMREHVSKT